MAWGLGEQGQEEHDQGEAHDRVDEPVQGGDRLRQAEHRRERHHGAGEPRVEAGVVDPQVGVCGHHAGGADQGQHEIVGLEDRDDERDREQSENGAEEALHDAGAGAPRLGAHYEQHGDRNPVAAIDREQAVDGGGRAERQPQPDGVTADGVRERDDARDRVAQCARSERVGGIAGARRDERGEGGLEQPAGEREAGQLELGVGSGRVAREDDQRDGGRQPHAACYRPARDEETGAEAPQPGDRERCDLGVGGEHPDHGGERGGDGGHEHRDRAVSPGVAEIREPDDQRSAAGEGPRGDVVGEHAENERDGDADPVADGEAEAEAGSGGVPRRGAHTPGTLSPEPDSNRRPPPYHGGALAC